MAKKEKSTKKEEFSVNVSFCIRAIKSVGMRAGNSSKGSFATAVNAYAGNLAKVAGEKATARGRKTVESEDVEAAVEQLSSSTASE